MCWWLPLTSRHSTFALLFISLWGSKLTHFRSSWISLSIFKSWVIVCKSRREATYCYIRLTTSQIDIDKIFRVDTNRHFIISEISYLFSHHAWRITTRFECQSQKSQLFDISLHLFESTIERLMSSLNRQQNVSWVTLSLHYRLLYQRFAE